MTSIEVVGAFVTPQLQQGKKKENIKSMNLLLLHRPLLLYIVSISTEILTKNK